MTVEDRDLKLAVNALVGEWRRDKRRLADCPRCQQSTLEIADRSTPPHAEWYIVTCKGCGLETAVQYPRGSPYVTID